MNTKRRYINHGPISLYTWVCLLHLDSPQRSLEGGGLIPSG
ncbi:MAG: hypothetical protein ACI9W2_003864 [Gammaproteobacteria bacterium]